jgi:hypothetical protein
MGVRNKLPDQSLLALENATTLDTLRRRRLKLPQKQAAGDKILEPKDIDKCET